MCFVSTRGPSSLLPRTYIFSSSQPHRNFRPPSLPASLLTPGAARHRRIVGSGAHAGSNLPPSDYKAACKPIRAGKTVVDRGFRTQTRALMADPCTPSLPPLSPSSPFPARCCRSRRPSILRWARPTPYPSPRQNPPEVTFPTRRRSNVREEGLEGGEEEGGRKGREGGANVLLATGQTWSPPLSPLPLLPPSFLITA